MERQLEEEGGRRRKRREMNSILPPSFSVSAGAHTNKRCVHYSCSGYRQSPGTREQ